MSTLAISYTIFYFWIWTFRIYMICSGMWSSQFRILVSTGDGGLDRSGYQCCACYSRVDSSNSCLKTHARCHTKIDQYDAANMRMFKYVDTAMEPSFGWKSLTFFLSLKRTSPKGATWKYINTGHTPPYIQTEGLTAHGRAHKAEHPPLRKRGVPKRISRSCSK